MKKMTKRTIRNLIMILMIVALGAGAYLTMNYAADSMHKGGFSTSAQGDFGGGPGGQQGSKDGTENSSDSNAQPPEMPNGDSSGSTNGQPPEMPNGDSSGNTNGQPPEMPNGDSSGNTNGQPPERPDGNAENADSTDGSDPIASFGSEDSTDASADATDTASSEKRQKPDGMPGGMGSRRKNTKFSTVYYVVFAAEGLLMAALLLYLIMSGFNKKGFKETFRGWKRIVIYLLSVAIVATCLTATASTATTRYFAGNSTSHGPMMPGGNGGMQGNSSQTSVETNGATSVDGKEETLSESYTSTASDESAILVTNGGNATVSGATITKSGDSTNTENSEFYGVNAAVLVQSGSNATIKGATINTDAKGANAVFATGEDAKITISDSVITSTGASSARGLDATYGGTIEADNVTVTTQGGSCAALATDRGEGTVSAKNSDLTTNGAGSPVIYSTGNISIENTEGTANGAQMVVIEGKNSATVTKSTLSASAAGNRGDVDIAGIMIYQSMSGDASEGTGTFTATDSSLEIQSNSKYYKSAPMFFITNTDAVINLTNTKLSFGSGILLNAQGTSEWGSEGKNGGNVTLNAENQTLTGDITADKLSTVTLNLSASTYEGAVNSDNSAKEVTLKLDKDSRIKLTGDTYVTALDDEDTTYSNIDFGSYTLYVGGTAIN